MSIGGGNGDAPPSRTIGKSGSRTHAPSMIDINMSNQNNSALNHYGGNQGRRFFNNGSPGKKDQLQYLGQQSQTLDPSYDEHAQKKFGEEAKLLEQDPFMLEE